MYFAAEQRADWFTQELSRGGFAAASLRTSGRISTSGYPTGWNGPYH